MGALIEALTSTAGVAFLSVIGIWVIFYSISAIRWRRRSHGRPLPPGPRAPPFIGNVAHMAKPEVWRAHTELFKQYGDVVYLPVLGSSIVILGSEEAMFDLLEKLESPVTSDREQTPLIALSGQDFNFALMPYGHQWREHRREFSQQFSTVTELHEHIQRTSAQLFLFKLLKDPENLLSHIRYSFSATIVKAAYGLEIAESKDKNIALMESVLEGFQAFAPGRFLVQYLPILQHVPLWMPIAGRQLRELSVWRGSAHRVKQTLFSITEKAVEEGVAPPSAVANILREIDGEGKDMAAELKEIAKNVAVTAFEGAVDTTYTTIQFFLIAMSLNPAAQKKAQAELDAVVGAYRLPLHKDRPLLPYLNAAIKETIRWHTSGPIAIPHFTNDDLEYRGYFIPKGTTLIPVIWACFNDPKVFPDPERFIPERFLRDGELDPTVRDPVDFAFGFGRRRCPGIDFASASLFINAAMVLHTFDILPPLDENGNVDLREPEIVGTMVTYPKECRVRLRPRSSQAEALIRAANE
ncbi:cytochrome P450 [Daedaleopsis nitida]|nr:cytochrome P450 [Daedaleopsis nitida]